MTISNEDAQAFYQRMLPLIEILKKDQAEINADCVADGDDDVPFSNTGYYAEQIACVLENGLTYEEALIFGNALAPLLALEYD